MDHCGHSVNYGITVVSAKVQFWKTETILVITNRRNGTQEIAYTDDGGAEMPKGQDEAPHDEL